MSERCSSTIQLRLYFKDMSRPTTLFNVELLCDQCHARKKKEGELINLPLLNKADIASAYLIAGNRCQCDSDDCH